MKILRYFAILLFISVMSACSKSNTDGTNLTPSGMHPAGWVAASGGGNHPAAYLQNPLVCTECHGKSYEGGITGISCFTASRNGVGCHAGGPSGHPANWSDPNLHGTAAKTIVSGLNGMSHCQVCHGADFAGGTSKKSCLNTAGCHGAAVAAPHSPVPWRSTIGGRKHTDTDVTNASACAVCHTNGANSSRTPLIPAPGGTAAGCFNNTLCHGVEGHPTGWNAPAQHGVAAKAVAGGDKGFSYCTQCHGTNYQGGAAQQTCLSTDGCHGAAVAAPHPGDPWRSTTGGLTHTTTDTSNAGQCAVCHTAGANSSRVPQAGATIGLTGCYNNTLCHGASGHAAGWSAAAVHGAEAKKAPSGSTGFSSCQTCHGTTFTNGSAVTCFNNAACHGTAVNAPHARKPWTSTTGGVTHTTTNQGNVSTCAGCHSGGANSTVKPPVPVTGVAAGCFNATMCHFHAVDAIGTFRTPAVHGPPAKADLATCQNCHGVKTTTAFDGALLADGTRTTACSSCHTAAKAHPTDWQGSGTYSHRTAGNTATACAICHKVNAAGTSPLPAAPSCFSATFTNGLGQARTCHASGPGVAPHAVPYNNHNATARSNFNYCLGCHQVAANAAGSQPPGCQNCHLTSPVATPNGCTSCHANPPNGAAYPNIAGRHAAHGSINASNVCTECHSGLGLGTVDHLNRSRARTASVQANPVVFGTLAKTGGLVPTYNATNGTCALTYCHGNGSSMDKPASAVLTPSWNTPFLTGVAANDCIKCHGYPPANATHSGKVPTDCIGCHPHVNAAGTGFTNASLHIDGSIQAIGAHAFPNPGSLHKSASNGTGCITSGCHGTNAAGSPYPVTAGVAPNCRACHLNANPTTDPKCSDCHGSTGSDGSSTRGRPNGSVFPNRNGEHGNGNHSGRTCTTCHPFTTGNAAHGWSNGNKSTSAQVLPSLNWVPGTRAPGQGSCNPSAGGMSGCHGSEGGWY
jgi:predicted CxxxxCH...CXXCH cytochrome family protein